MIGGMNLIDMILSQQVLHKGLSDSTRAADNQGFHDMARSAGLAFTLVL